MKYIDKIVVPLVYNLYIYTGRIKGTIREVWSKNIQMEGQGGYTRLILR